MQIRMDIHLYGIQCRYELGSKSYIFMENDRIISLTNLFQHLLSVQIYLIEKLNLGDLWGGGGGGGDGGWASDQIFKKGDLDKISVFRGGCSKKGEWVFSGGCSFHIKNKLKSEIFNDKKNFINKNVFLCHN